MKVAFQIPVAALQACALFASADETRDILRGVAIELSFSGHVILVATDGRRLFGQRVKCEMIGSQECEGKTVVVPSSLIAVLPEPPEDCRGLNVEIEWGKAGGPCISLKYQTHCGDGVTISGNLVVGNFPKWRDVVECFTDKTLIPALGTAVNGLYLQSFCAAAEKYGMGSGLSVSIEMLQAPGDKFGPIVVDAAQGWGGNDILAIVMPMRGLDDDVVKRVPRWALPPEKSESPELKPPQTVSQP